MKSEFCGLGGHEIRVLRLRGAMKSEFYGLGFEDLRV